jgi:adenosylhomocysteinase
VIIDDGGDLVHLIHTEFRENLPHVLGGCEETTTGIIRLAAMNSRGELSFPMVMVNNADCKHLFDNRYGTGQSVWDGINRTTNLIVAGKDWVVAGYGWCGKGVAMRAKGLGAKVIVTEIDPVKALEAHMDGFEVMKMNDAAKIGDIFVTVTGVRDIITEADFAVMKDGAICCNAGHFDIEVDVAWLRANAVKTFEARHNIMGYTLAGGNTVYIIAEGRLVNLAAGDGHPAEIMDMSFAIQALSAAYLAANKGKITDKLIDVPREIDMRVAKLLLEFKGLEIDSLTQVQKEYIES